MSTWELIGKKFKELGMLFIDYPLLDIGLAIAILVIAIFNMDSKQSSAGMYGIIIVAVALFLFGMCNLFGVSFGMSF